MTSSLFKVESLCLTLVSSGLPHEIALGKSRVEESCIIKKTMALGV